MKTASIKNQLRKNARKNRDTARTRAAEELTRYFQENPAGVQRFADHMRGKGAHIAEGLGDVE